MGALRGFLGGRRGVVVEVPLSTTSTSAQQQQAQGEQGGPAATAVCPLHQSVNLEEQRASPQYQAALALGFLCVATTWLLPAGAAHAGEGTLTGQSVELFKSFLEHVEDLGPLGAVLFVAVVMLFEMVPLFPTQPLSLASGLLFGPKHGALLMLLGVTLAALNAFFISRGVGRPLAQKIIDMETGSHGGNGSSGSHGGGGVAKTLADVQAAIDGGGPWKQMTAIVLLRLTPVVPFSASNYLLGLTPVQLPAFLAGTLVGMSGWAALYASLGGASRTLLDKGADLETLLADLGAKAGAVSSNAVWLTVGLLGAGLAAYTVRALGSGKQDTRTASGPPQGELQQPPLQPQQPQQPQQAEQVGGEDGEELVGVQEQRQARREVHVGILASGRGGSVTDSQGD